VSLDLAWRDSVSKGEGRSKGHRNTSLAGDARVDWSEAFALVPSLTVGYVWHAGVHAAEVAEGLVRIGFDIVSPVVWDKGTWPLSSPKRASEEEAQDHPTQKPALLYEAPIRNHTRRGDALYDPFVGSGTAIIAAERSDRRCYAMDVDPRYVQIAKERWETLTGKEAEKADG